MILETKDLILRSGREEDWKDLHDHLWREEAVFRYLFTKPSDTEACSQKRTAAYAQMHREVKTEFFVCEKQTGRVIGIAGIKERTAGVFTVTDIAIGPAFAGKGYGKQILGRLSALAFEVCGAKELWYDCFDGNLVSRRLAESCGFVYSHSEEAELKKNGNTIQLAYYRLEK